MRRKDREITDYERILSIVDACQIVRLGLADGDFPYIVPVNFAYQVREGQLYLYIHGAMAGRKYALLSACPRCSFEMDLPLGLCCLPEKKDVTMRYQSVMGQAEARFLTGEERQRAIDDIIMQRDPATRNFAYNKTAVEKTAVVELHVMALSAKANMGAADL